MFLSREELFELTERKMAHAQCRWLTDHGYPYDKSASGKPKVLRSYLERRLCPESVLPGTEEPNFDAIR